MHFLYGNYLGTILSSLVEIHQVVMEEMSFEFFSIFCSSLHFEQWSRTFSAILVEDLPRNSSSFVEIRSVVTEEMLFEVFFFYF